MKTLTKSYVSLAVGVAMLVTSPIRACADEAVASGFLAASNEVAGQIAADLRAQLQLAKSMPLPVRIRRSPSVEVADLSAAELEATYAQEMDVIVVEATRLPPLPMATVATRYTTYTRY